MITPGNHNDTPREYASPPIRLDPGERVVERMTCWREECRHANGDYATVAWLTNGRVVAFCHRKVHDDLGYTAEVWYRA